MNSSSQTFFDVVDFANTRLETSAVRFSSTSGTVTITGASVPEPGSIVSGLTAVMILVAIVGAPPPFLAMFYLKTRSERLGLSLAPA